MTDLRMPIPVKSCPHCWVSFTVEEWQQLEPVDRDAPGWLELEVRRCTCGEPLELQLSGLDELELTAPVVAYSQEYPESARPAQALAMLDARNHRASGARVFFWVGVALTVVLCAAIAIISLFGGPS